MKWGLATLSLIIVALAMCTPKTVENVKIPWNDAWTISLKLMSQVYTAKVNAEIILLKIENPYQRYMYDAITRDLQLSKRYQNMAKIYEAQGLQTKAALYYLASFKLAYEALKLIQLYKINTLTEYEQRLSKVGELFSALTFSSFKVAVLGKGCVNSTRVIYAYLYKLFKNTSFRINTTMKTLPTYFTQNLAKVTVGIVSDLASALTYQMASYYLSQSGCTKDVKLPSIRGTCPEGMAPPFPWTYSACYLVNHPHATKLPSSPCVRFYAYLAYLLKDNNTLEIVCSMG